MNNHKFLSENLQIIFSEDPFLIEEICDRRSGKRFCRNGKQNIIIRSPLHISDPSTLFELESFKSTEEGVIFVLIDDKKENKAEIKITDSRYGVKFNLSVSASEIIWLAEWKLTGFDFNEVIIPALGGQSLTDNMTPETTLSYKYPFWWNAQFVIGERGRDGLWLHTKDTSPDLKLLRVRKDEKTFQLTLGFESEAPLQKKTIEAEWYIDSYQKNWRVPVNRHRKWLEESFELKRLQDNPHVPDWVHNINFTLSLWGMRKDQAEPHHTFDQMIERIKHWKKFHPPENTLLYLPGFAENGIDSHAPDYHPSDKCGGEAKFIELIETAHQLGYKVMLHTNVLAMTFTHPLYEKFKEFRVIDVFDRPIGWAMDIDGDWLPEEYFAYINPGYKEWGDLMEGVIGKLLNYNADAVFLDQTLLAFNVSKGPNFLCGMREHILRMQKAFPNILFAGEGLNEQVLPVLPFAQIHGIDSLTEVHGMEGKKRWRKVHPVSSYLFGKYTRFNGHLLTKYPGHRLFRLQESSYRRLNVIPVLSLYDYKQKINVPEVARMLERAVRLKRKFQRQDLHYKKLERS